MSGRAPLVRFDSGQAARFLVIDYDPLIPIAPGVALIKAAGHTLASQIVFVRLASGQEVLLAGDIAWAMSGIETQRQKSEAASRSLGEDRASIGRQLEWLRRIASGGIIVVVSHDDDWLTALSRRRGCNMTST
jgi:glyoxylase-like metal-dependent hydrolase (beta-lactamase superfamily II)